VSDSGPNLLNSRKIAFFGSPAFALPVLEALREHFEVVLVVAQPSKPAGRGLKLTPPAVASMALELGLALEQPAKLRGNLEFAETLRSSGANVAVTCAYGKILPASLLEIPQFGFLNVHTSLLPKYRGAAPIQWAVIDGLRETGVTIMQTDPGLDTGPILLQERLSIGPDETSLELAPRLSEMGARMILEAIRKVDTLERITQDDSEATLARLLEKDDGRIRWAASANAIYDRFRGVAGWPGTFFEYDGKMVKAHEVRPLKASGRPGEVLEVRETVIVAALEGAIELRLVQPEGKPRMNAVDWARGYRLKPGMVL
jgi:methionyl-tRNA formyltransferase